MHHFLKFHEQCRKYKYFMSIFRAGSSVTIAARKLISAQINISCQPPKILHTINVIWKGSYKNIRANRSRPMHVRVFHFQILIKEPTQGGGVNNAFHAWNKRLENQPNKLAKELLWHFVELICKQKETTEGRQKD